MNVNLLSFYFIDKEYRQDLEKGAKAGSKSGQLTSEYAQLLQEAINKETIAPSKLKEVIGKHDSKFEGYGQKDVSELLIFFINALHEDLNIISR